MSYSYNTKYCMYCGEIIPFEAVICPQCGRQVENSGGDQHVYHHYDDMSHVKDKGIALVLCLLFGVLGAHKFYEGKIGMGILYLLTGGLLGIGWLIDLFVLLFKPNPYYV
ncbi:hypothetical protein SDC9_127281 [bioreactor metagenome]|uniref:TM2 domain-containing protein n=1 Tax=bioreactor metagenome TaxID=1076179 RepID=A0A645CTJ9_9ZZZZ